jgi:hypothetical protein
MLEMAFVWDIGIWKLEFVWNLVLEIWNFSFMRSLKVSQMRARLLACLLLALPALLAAQYKPWYNYYNFAYGAKAQAMGNAFTAVADDLTACFWNPAGLVAIRTPEFYLGYKATSQRHDYDLQDKAFGRDTRLYTYDFASRLNQIDFFAISTPFTLLKRPATFALGYYRYIPYGFKGSDTGVLTFLHDLYNPLRSTVTFAGSEGFDVLAFSLGARLARPLSLGVTLQQFFGSGSLYFTTEATGERDSHRQLSEKLQGRSVIVGLLLTPFTSLRLGLAWHSGLKGWIDSTLVAWEVNKRGELVNEQHAACEARVVIPRQYSLGALLLPAGWLSLSADYAIIDWDKGSIAGYYDDGPPLPYPQDGAWSGGQKQVRDLRFGLEARMPLGSWRLSLRLGGELDRQLYADVDGNPVKVACYSGGIGCQFSPNLLVELAYQRQRADWQENGYFGQRPDASTHYRANVLFLSLTYHFGQAFE